MMTSIAELRDPSSRAYKKANRQYCKATKYRSKDIDLEWTPFRAAEKRYKARFPPPDLSDVLDLAMSDETRVEEVKQSGWFGRIDAAPWSNITQQGGPKAYILPRIPGLVLLPSFVSPHHQRELIKWALSDHARQPNETNLDIHYVLPPKGIWNSHLETRNDPSQETIVLPKAADLSQISDTMDVQIQPPGPRQLVNNTAATPDNFDPISHTPKLPAAPSTTVRPCPASSLIYKLRWANIGWFYHWGSKQYDFTKGKGKVDNQIRDVCKSAVGCVDWERVYGDDMEDWGSESPGWRGWNETYEPDAGIVNFYQNKDMLMAHVDRSEICATSPLVSISLGNAAVFLIGRLTREVEPVPILLRSGDVVIMSGPACRRAYHGIPRILENTLPQHLRGGDEDWEAYEEYMQTTRININARQVFPKGFVPDVVHGVAS